MATDYTDVLNVDIHRIGRLEWDSPRGVRQPDHNSHHWLNLIGPRLERDKLPDLNVLVVSGGRFSTMRDGFQAGRGMGDSDLSNAHKLFGIDRGLLRCLQSESRCPGMGEGWLQISSNWPNRPMGVSWINVPQALCPRGKEGEFLIMVKARWEAILR